MHLLRRTSGTRGRGIRTGPVPGYAFIPPNALDVEGIARTLAAGLPPWTLLSLETLNTASRTRGVLRIAIDGHPPRNDAWSLLRLLALATLRASDAHVIVVEAFDDPTPPPDAPPVATLLLAPDALGWNGTSHGVAVIDAVYRDAPILHHALAGSPDAPGFGWILPEHTSP
ncbi:MAG: hypothetical protein EA398_10110 [Deltaproteobacteria bacterium]|nr:MAG: hypothetical protein EA398_10110 [Deltaproteobacteria bacterium]